MLLALFCIYILGVVITFSWIASDAFNESKGMTLCLVWPLVFLKILIKDMWVYFRHW